MDIYTSIVTLETISLFALLITTIAIFANWKHRTYSHLFLFSFAALINNFGFLIELTGKTSSEMLIGVKVEYLGKAFIPFAIFLFVVQYFEVKVPKIIKAVLFTYHLFIFIMVFTTDYHKLYYTSITYTESGIFPHNVYGHGIIYNIHAASLFIYIITFIIFAIYKMTKANNRKKRIQMLLILLSALFPIIAYIVYILNITMGYDCTSLSYFISAILMAVAIIRYDLLEVIEAVGDYVTDNISAGLIALDAEGSYIYNNIPALEIFPNLKEDNQTIIEEIVAKEKASSHVKKDGKVYKVSSTVLASRYRVLGTLYILDDVTEEYIYNENIKKVAMTDGLTGLGNRRSFEKAIMSYADKVIEADYVHVAMDINGLKRVNDTYGHAAGDELIVAAAACIKNSFEEYGKLYRIGGDEFVALLHISQEDLARAREKLMALIAEWRGSIDEELVISIGTASSKEFPFYTTMELAKEADTRMYADKRFFYVQTGRDRRK